MNDEVTTFIGYWAVDENDSSFPKPIANSATIEQKTRFQYLWKLLQTCRPRYCMQENGKRVSFAYTAYRGSSKCRICEKLNGNEEYHISISIGNEKSKKLIIPSGYGHYVIDHGVEPNAYLMEVLESVTSNGLFKTL